MTVTTSAYQVRELRPDDEPAVLSLLTASLSGGPTGERTSAFLRWKHQANPAGRSPGLVATTPGGDVVAVRLLLRWDLELDGSAVRAVRAVDTATHPDHQGKGLFRRLTLEALDTVASDADLVFNTPNASSRPGYLKMGWQEVGILPVRLRPVRPLRFLRGLGSAGQEAVTSPLEPVQSTLVRAVDLLQARGDDVAGLLATLHDPAGRLHTRRDLEHLLWRYSAPGLDYRAVVIDSATGLRALGLGRLRRRGPLVELTLGEVLAAPDDLAGARRVLRGAARAEVDHVAALLPAGSPFERTATTAGYLRVPGKGMLLVANPRRPLPVDARDPRAWALTLGDLEVF